MNFSNLYRSVCLLCLVLFCLSSAHEPRKRAGRPARITTNEKQSKIATIVKRVRDTPNREEQHDDIDIEQHINDHRKAPAVVDHMGPPGHSHRSEFTFNLPARTASCFGEHFHAEFRNYTFEYKRVRGEGKAQVIVRDHTDTVIYDKSDVEWDLINFLTVPGDFTFCFNSQSYMGVDQTTYYMRLDESNAHAKLHDRFGPGAPEMRSALCEGISTQLVKVSSEQKHWRLESETGRAYADILHSRLAFLTVFATIGLTLVNVGQTFALRHLFRTIKVPRLSGQGERAYRIGSVDYSASEYDHEQQKHTPLAPHKCSFY